MKRVINTEHEIQAPVDNVWKLIAQGDGVESWIPIIKSSKIENGNRRFCEMHEGGDLEETFLKSEAKRTFMYSIDKQAAFPATNIVGTIKVEPITESRTRLYWDVEMDVEGEETFSELKNKIVQVYTMSAAQLNEVA
ncbi:MAG: SRPBCC family protein [Cytophagales bacterium]|nr:SRPBCC family protein [Cytophagales bacterium]